MRQTPLTNPYKFSVNIRPVKIAYFIVNTSAQVLRNLVPLICTQWGGIRHLIIVLEKDYSISGLDQYLLKIHEPDRYVLYDGLDKSNERTILNSIQNQLHQILPQRHITIESSIHFEKSDDTAHALHVIPDTVVESKVLTLPHVTDAQFDVMNALLFGEIYPGQEEFYQNSLTTIVKDVKYGTEEFWLSQMEIDPFSSILNLTSYQIGAYNVADGSYDAFDHFDLVISDSLDDYATFWNMRALRECTKFPFNEEWVRRTLFLPIDLLDRPDSINTLFELIRQKLFRPGRTANLDIRLYSWKSEVINKVKVALQECPLVMPFTEQTILGDALFGTRRHITQQPIEPRLLTYKFCNISVPGKYLETVSTSLPLIVNLSYGRNEIRFEPPDKYSNRYGRAVAVDFQCNVWARYPKVQSVASKIEQNSWFSKYGITSTMRLSARPTFIHFNLPDESEALRIYFRKKGYELTDSKIDQYSNALVDLVGGLQGISVFASKNCYQLLDSLAVKSTKKVAQRIVKELKLSEAKVEEIIRVFDSLELPEEIKDIPRTSSQMATDQRIGLSSSELFDLLDTLVQSKILRRGYYLDCPTCGNAEWYSLNQIDESLMCPGCGIKFVLRARENGREEDIKWRYRLNTTVNRAVDQDVLVGVLALYHLSKTKQIGCFGFGLQLLKAGKQISDIDFVCVSNSEILAGECKSGTRLGQKDFDNARVIIQLGVKSFYFATVREFDSETQAEIQKFIKSLEEDNISANVITLSGAELLGMPL